MGLQYVDELLLSLKELYKTSVYSDLTLECGDDEHKVHKAVVCPRSKRLAGMLDKDSEDGQDTLVLHEDNPQAVGLMLHYLYHLDYLEVQVHEQEGVNAAQAPQTNASSNSDHLDKNHNGIANGSHHYDTNGHIQRPMDYSIEKEQFIDATTVSSPTGTGDTSSEAGFKKSKKKKRRSAQAESSSEVATSANTSQTQAQAQEQSSPLLTSSSTLGVTPAKSNVNTTTAPIIANANANVNTTVVTTPTSTTQKQKQQSPSNLTIHAQLYALASKYGVEGLAALAADKFERGVGHYWGTEDFLNAAREAYTSTDRADRRLRDAVLGAVKAHPELLARQPVQDAIRGLELSFDLLMLMRGSGVGMGVGGM